MPAPAIELRRVSKLYREGETERVVFRDVDATVKAGEIAVLVGRSGSGKSTLLNLIAGLDRPTQGDLSVLGRSLAAMTSRELSLHRRTSVGIVFQSFHLIPTMTALQNTVLPMIFAGMAPDERERRGRRMLEIVGLADRGEHRPSELSGGEQQRVAIARALANGPEILLADEPTGNLDRRTAREILELVRRLHRDEGKTVVLVTHDRAVASDFVTRTFTLLDGRVVAEERS
jgi:ABC-type lipoprotein export system ATPase subunit